MIKKHFCCLLFLGLSSFSYASTQKYTISVCTTSTLENALFCKNNILKQDKGNVSIVKNKNGKYSTYLGIYENESSVKNAFKSVSNFVIKQKPFIKLIPLEEYADLNLEEIKPQEKVEQKEVLKVEAKKNEEILEIASTQAKLEDLEIVKSYPYNEGEKLTAESFEIDKKIKEELLKISMEEFDKFEREKEIEEPTKVAEEQIKKEEEIKKAEAPKPVMVETKAVIEEKVPEKIVEKVAEKPVQIIIPKEEPKIVKKESFVNPNTNISQYEEILIEVDSVKNFMTVKAKIDNELTDIKTYVVSTAKKDVQKPFGFGKISQISLNPTWYPTDDTLRSFRKRGIYLPNAVPPGHKYNYMGSAKINLTHRVNGKDTFRIHGTLDEKTIGTNESAGCIRMKNGDVIQLARLLNDFSSLKSLDKVKVHLR